MITRRTKCPETQITVLRMASALPPGVEKSSRAGAPRSRKPACLRGAIQVARDACRGTDHLCGASRWLPHGDWPNALVAHLRERKTDGLASFIARLCGPMAGTAEPMEFPECSSRTPAWCEFLRRIMIAGEEPCVLSAPKGKPRRGCATAGFPAPGPTGDRNYWDRRGNAPAPPVFRDARYATPGSVGWGRTRTHHAVFGVALLKHVAQQASCGLQHRNARHRTGTGSAGKDGWPVPC